MSAKKRQEEIIELVSKNGKMPVEELAEILEVTPMTIRRDLADMEAQEILGRVHGAAVMKKEMGYAQKMEYLRAEKEAIAKCCMKLVQPGDTIFLDAGTTTLEIARGIQTIPNLIVITNDLEIAYLLHQCSSIEVMLCGGMIQKETGSIFGVFANQMMGYVQMDKAFLGAASINAKYNVLTPTIDKASLKRLIANHADESYLVVDQSKFNRKALMKINNMKDYTGVITTKQFGELERDRMDKLGIHLITAQVEAEAE